MGRGLREFGHRGVLAGSLALAGCGAPTSESYPVPVPATELARLLPGHLIRREPTAPCDAGALSFPAPGKFLAYNGFGNASGTYRIVDGAVELDGIFGGKRDRFRVRFARDPKGTLLHAYPDSELRPAVLDPINARTVATGCH
jgi:hypothetical protein